MGWLKIQKLEYLESRTYFFYELINLCFRCHILRSYCFVAEVTFNDSVINSTIPMIFYEKMLTQDIRKVLKKLAKLPFNFRNKNSVVKREISNYHKFKFRRSSKFNHLTN